MTCFLSTLWAGIMRHCKRKGENTAVATVPLWSYLKAQAKWSRQLTLQQRFYRIWEGPFSQSNPLWPDLKTKESQEAESFHYVPLQSDIPTISLVSPSSWFWLALLEEFCTLPRISEPAVLQHGLSLSCHVLENSGVSTGRAGRPLCFWKMQNLLGTAPLRTATAGKLWGSHAASTASPTVPEVPRLLHSHGGHVLQSHQCLMALGWPCNMVPTADTVELKNPRLSMKVLVKLAACHRRACW